MTVARLLSLVGLVGIAVGAAALLLRASGL